MDMKKFAEMLQSKFPLMPLKEKESLAKYSYTKTGGQADLFAMPRDMEEAKALIALIDQHDVPLTVIGNGSNLVIRDGGIRGIVVHFDLLSSIKREGTKVISGSGAKIIAVSEFACNESLSGLEFACGIPGSVGGALYMNAGAYGGEISQVLVEATVLDQSGNLLHLEKEDLTASYRNSTIANKNYIVLEAVFQLELAEMAVIRAQMDELTALREAKQPLEYPSCGSVFKRPPGYFAGKLIQDAGLQGLQIGGAQVSEKHAGFIVNVDHATATDYMDVIHHVQKVIKEKFDVILETEVKIIGEERPNE